MLELWRVLNLNGRELAILTWIGVFAVLAGIKARDAMAGVFRAFLNRWVFGVFVALAAYTIGVVWLFKGLSLWDASLLKDTILWFLTAGCVSVVQSVKAAEKPHFFRDIIFDAFKITVLVKFVLDNFVLPYGWEVGLVVPGSLLLGGMLAVADSRKEHRVLVPYLLTAVNYVASFLLVYAIYGLIKNFAGFATTGSLKQLLTPLVLTISSLPFLVAFALLAYYKDHFIRLDFWLKEEPRLKRRAKWQSLRECGFRLPRLRKLTGTFFSDVQDTKTKAEVDAIVRRYAHAPDPVHLSGEVVAVRIVSYTRPGNGVPAQKVLIDWKNTSDRPVTAAFADITPYSEDGDLLEFSGARDYCIFSSDDKIPPGGTYIQPDDGGFILPNALGVAAHIDVRITKLLEF